MDLLKELTNIFGPSGREGEIREFIKTKIAGSAEFRVDPMGNLIVHKKGSGKKLMFIAHMDEIGFMITEIDQRGFLRFTPLGKPILRFLPGKMVKFANGTHGVIGVESEDGNKELDLSGLFIDVGGDHKEVTSKVKIGDVAVFATPFRRQDNYVIGKALDDRIGCYLLITLIKENPPSPFDLYFVFAVQAEVGLRGEKTSAYSIQPDYAISISPIQSGDIPKGPPVPVKLNHGVAVTVKDERMITMPVIRDRLIELCQEEGIKYQMGIRESGSSGGASAQLSRFGVPTGAISIPTRYLHTGCEMSSEADIEAALNLLRCLVRKGI